MSTTASVHEVNRAQKKVRDTTVELQRMADKLHSKALNNSKLPYNELGETLQQLNTAYSKLNDITTQLNMTCRGLMENSVYQAELVMMCTRWNEVIGLLRDTHNCTTVSCCWSYNEPFNGNAHMRVAAERLEQKTISVRGNFQIQIHVQGSATLAGQVGHDVRLMGGSHAVQMSAPTHTTTFSSAMLPIHTQVGVPTMVLEPQKA